MLLKTFNIGESIQVIAKPLSLSEIERINWSSSMNDITGKTGTIIRRFIPPLNNVYEIKFTNPAVNWDLSSILFEKI